MRIHSLYYYPVKSLAQVSTDSLTCEEAGPRWDREWMLVDGAGKFVTQRELPAMALLHPKVDATHLTVSSADGHSLRVPLDPVAREITSVQVFSDSVNAWDEGNEAADWFSQRLGRELRLVRYGPGGRLTGKEGEERKVRFPDSYPLLVVTRESLAEINSRLPEPQSVLRYRANVVLEGASAPWEEDQWSSLEIGEHEFPVGKACTRCPITTVDPATGNRGPEPLRTLATFRRQGTKVVFGVYLRSSPGAVLRTGASVKARLK